MAQLSRSVGIILVLIIGFVVQFIFSIVDVRDTPNKAVVEFSKAYFELDKSMTKRICKKQLASEDVDVVDEYLYFAAKTAIERGFDINFLASPVKNAVNFSSFLSSESEPLICIESGINFSSNLPSLLSWHQIKE